VAVDPHSKVYELVDKAVRHDVSVPEFQRGFVWKPTQVRDLAESLWMDFPVGSLLIWDSHDAVEERIARDARKPTLWVVDGQQRTTALCILFGRKPYWWPSAEDWDKTLKRYDIRFDINAKESPYFHVANAAIRKARGDRYISLSRLLVLDTSKDKDQKILMDLAKEVKAQGLCDGMDAMEVYTRLDRVRKIREKDNVVITVSHELEDVVEIFSRLNSKGTRVTEADIYLGIVASKSPGWVRDNFLPFLKVLKESGFDISPNLLFKSLTAIAAGKTRFKEIQDETWEPKTISTAWEQCKLAWKNLIKRLAEYGVMSNDPLPTEAALVTLIYLENKFPDSSSFDFAFYWFLQASRFGRYSSSSTTSLDEDIKDIAGSSDLIAAVRNLLKRFDHEKNMGSEEFLRDYSDTRFGRFLLYLMIFKNEARDWDSKGFRLGFDGTQILADFKPQWHHIYPQRFLEDKVDDDKIQALANIAVIGPSINIRISAKDPMNYFDRYQISQDKLKQQFVLFDKDQFKIENYELFINERARELSVQANNYLSTLAQGLNGEP
jgi:hypothetical protein